MTTEMKLSDAMEQGWSIAPQSWEHGWGVKDGAGNWIGVCAVGAALVGVDPNTAPHEMDLGAAVQLFPQLCTQVSQSDLPPGLLYEEGGLIFGSGADVSDVIQCMNDHLHKPGPEIVAYLRQIGY
jgi:hypothetical protein